MASFPPFAPTPSVVDAFAGIESRLWFSSLAAARHPGRDIFVLLAQAARALASLPEGERAETLDAHGLSFATTLVLRGEHGALATAWDLGLVAPRHIAPIFLASVALFGHDAPIAPAQAFVAARMLRAHLADVARSGDDALVAAWAGHLRDVPSLRGARLMALADGFPVDGGTERLAFSAPALAAQGAALLADLHATAFEGQAWDQIVAFFDALLMAESLTCSAQAA